MESHWRARIVKSLAPFVALTGRRLGPPRPRGGRPRLVLAGTLSLAAVVSGFTIGWRSVQSPGTGAAPTTGLTGAATPGPTLPTGPAQPTGPTLPTRPSPAVQSAPVSSVTDPMTSFTTGPAAGPPARGHRPGDLPSGRGCPDPRPTPEPR